MNIAYQGIAFDLDGVLVDSHTLHVKTWDMTLRHYGIVPDEVQLHASCGMTSRSFATALKETYRSQIPISAMELAQQKRDLFARLSQTELMPVVGADELLDVLASETLLGLCTMATQDRVESILMKFGWQDRFHLVLTCEQVKKPKPDPSIYQSFCTHLNIDPNRALVFEDTPLGIEAAAAAGLQAIGVTTTYPPEELFGKGAIATVPNLLPVHCHDIITIGKLSGGKGNL